MVSKLLFMWSNLANGNIFGDRTGRAIIDLNFSKTKCYVLAKYQLMILGLRIQHMNRPVPSGGFKLPSQYILPVVMH